MKRSITQEHNYGCGVACIAFISGKPYQEVVSIMGVNKAGSAGFSCRELVMTLYRLRASYGSKYVKPRLRKHVYEEDVIVFIKRSKRYPDDHYLVRHSNLWMDPWLNLLGNKDVDFARSGFRKRLPRSAIYAIFPIK